MTKGWSPVKHISRDIAVATVAFIIVFAIQQNTWADACVAGSSRNIVLIGIGGISGTLTGTSIVATTVMVGWWNTGRLNTITSIPHFEDTMLLLLQSNTWILGTLCILSVCLAALSLPQDVERIVTPIYVAWIATVINYLRRTITLIYKAAPLVTKDIAN